MDAYSHSSRQSFLACPRKFYLGKMLRLERDRDTSGLRMGRVFADALELADEAPDLERAKVAAEGLVSVRYHKAMEEAERAGDLDRLKLEQVQLHVLVAAYLDRYRRSLHAEALALGGSIAIEREVEFDDPVFGPGRLDAIVEMDTRRIGLEDKLLTPGFWREASERQLRINAQVTAYFCAMRAAGTPIDELRYRVTFKPTIKPNSRTGETLSEYGRRLAARVRTEEGYAFREYQLYRTNEEMDAFERRTQSVHRMIHRAKLDVKRMGEAAFPASFGEACTQFGECEFLELCIHGGSAAGYRRKPDRAKLSAFQARVLHAVAHAFTGTVRVVDVAKQVAATDQQTRDALRRLYVLGMVYRERYGRHVGFGMTDLGQQWLDY
jgi:hypothetical protein